MLKTLKMLTANVSKFAFVFLAVLMTINSCCGQLDGNTYQISKDNWAVFEEMTTWISTSSLVYHMEADLMVPGNLIFSDRYGLKTTDGTDVSVIAGSRDIVGYQNGASSDARFNDIQSFMQQDNKILIVDSLNHCLRQLDRSTETVTDFAGNCTFPGYENGSGDSARFYQPTGVVKDMRNPSSVIITDYINHALRSLDLNTMEVTTLTKSDDLQYPKSIIWTSSGRTDNILVTRDRHINRFSFDGTSVVNISGNGYGFSDSNLASAMYAFLEELTQINSDFYVVADTYNNRLRIIDLVNNRVSSICTGNYDQTNGSISECDIKYPSSLLFLDNMLYIGTYSAIRKLPVSFKKSKPNVPSITTTTRTPSIMQSGDSAVAVVVLAVLLAVVAVAAIVFAILFFRARNAGSSSEAYADKAMDTLDS